MLFLFMCIPAMFFLVGTGMAIVAAHNKASKPRVSESLAQTSQIVLLYSLDLLLSFGLLYVCWKFS